MEKDERENMAEGGCRFKKQARSAEEKKMLSNRINRIVGQMTGIGKMVDEDRYCDDILIQLSAIDKAIKSLANVILDTHIHTCMVEEIQNGNTAVSVMDDRGRGKGSLCRGMPPVLRRREDSL